MAIPPNPRIYMADDFSWAKTGSNPTTSWQNFYTWDGHGALGAGLGRGTPRGYAFGGEPSSGVFSWAIINLDTLVPITSPTVGVCFGHDYHGLVGALTIVNLGEVGGPAHIGIATNASNHLQAYNGSGALLGTTDGVTGGAGLPEYVFPSSAIDGTGPMYHIEVIVTISNSVGTVQIWVEDTLVMDLTAKDTQNGGTGVIGNIEWHLEGSGGRRTAEVIVHDGTARLGSQWRVGYVPVATDGTYSDGTAVGAPTFLQAVDDDPADSEAEITTYGVLDASGTPKKTSFQSGAVPDTWLQIRDVHPQIVIEKSDGGTNTAKTGLKSGSTESYTTSAYAVPDQWVARRLAFRTNPDTGTPLWTLVTAQASEVIVDRES